jgi:hypothetical protein
MGAYSPARRPPAERVIECRCRFSLHIFLKSPLHRECRRTGRNPISGAAMGDTLSQSFTSSAWHALTRVPVSSEFKIRS